MKVPHLNNKREYIQGTNGINIDIFISDGLCSNCKRCYRCKTKIRDTLTSQKRSLQAEKVLISLWKELAESSE